MDDLIQRISAGRVIPIISNALYNDLIFDFDFNEDIGISPGEDNPSSWSVEEQLSAAWAQEIAYPLPEATSLPQVALYDRVMNSTDDYSAKRRYLNWLKNALLFLAEDDVGVDAERIKELKEILNSSYYYGFVDLVEELYYPRLVEGKEDPLQILARLPLPIYLTTSYYDFMKRALELNGKRPRTQICFWSGEPANISPEHRLDLDYRPTIENPVVYHLLGSEHYPESLVINEDDYLDFLIQVWQDLDGRLVPKYIRQSLAGSTLMLLGFQLQSWEFKALYNGVIEAESEYTPLRRFSLAVQPDLVRQSGIGSEAKAQSRKYMERLLQPANIELEWGAAEDFLHQLWQAWRS